MGSFYSSTFNRAIEFPQEAPSGAMPITSLDADPTEQCTLRCGYCFKGSLSQRRAMSLETAKGMIHWLVQHSGSATNIHISLLGGEPMLAFDMLTKWFPYAFNYSRQRNKSLSVGFTTNGTVLSEKQADIIKFWHIGLHLSMDGIPKIQDAFRVFPDGQGSSNMIEKNLPLIFKTWRTVHARSTIVPETVEYLAESFQYFLELGFMKVAFSLAESHGWNDQAKLDALRQQLRRVLEIYVTTLKDTQKYRLLTLVEKYFQSLNYKTHTRPHCGAGRGMLHVDVEGFIWPCHRFNGIEKREEFVLGHIEGGFHQDRHSAFCNVAFPNDMKRACEKCRAIGYCGCPCIAASWQVNGDFFSPTEGFCEATRIGYDVLTEFFDDLKEKDPVFWERLRDWVLNYQW